MNALRTSPQRPPAQPLQRPTAMVRRKQSHGAIAFELTLKIMVNVLIGVTAYAALSRLLPYNFQQQQRLQEIRNEFATTNNRLTDLRTDFNRSFDPKQAQSIMREQSNRISAGQRQILWLNVPDNDRSRQN